MPERDAQKRLDWDVEDKWDVEDERIVAALERVDIPRGAIDRVLLHLQGSAEPSSLAGIAVMKQTEEIQVQRLPAHATTAVAPPRAGRRVSRRMALGAGAGLAASAACVFLYIQSLPLTYSHVTGQCTAAIERILAAPPVWQSSTPEAAERLQPLIANVRQTLTLVGSTDIEADGLAAQCKLFKFVSRGGHVVYVFDFDEPRTVAGLTGQFQALRQSSSGWSLAAVQLPNQLLVVAVEGDLDRFFRSTPLA